MKQILAVLTVLLTVMISSVTFAAPTFTNLSTANAGANLATLVLESNETVTGYFTLLVGNNATCGTSAQVKLGKTSGDEAAPYSGSLPLTANTAGYYTVRNLAGGAGYTACLTADPVPDPDLTAVNLTTQAAALFTGLDWRAAGSAGFSAGQALFISMAFAPDGTPYVAFQDGANGGKVTVMKYSGSAWDTVGAAGFSAGTADYTSLAFSPDGTPYVAYSDFGYGGKATVMKYSGVSWSVVGSPGFSAAQASYTSLAFAPDGSPYVAYGGDDYGNNSKATVMMFDGAGWSIVGGGALSTLKANYTSLAFANGAPHVAYADYANSGKVTVKKYNGTSWSVVGSAGFSASDIGFISLAAAPDGSGTPYVAYSDYGYEGKATVMKFNGSGWASVGNAGFSPVLANSTSLSFAADGSPCLAYFDAGGSGKATVMQYSGSSWNTLGSSEFSASLVNAVSLAFAPDGTPFVAYGDDGNGSRATVMRLKNPLVISGTPAAIATVGTAYSFTPTIDPPGTPVEFSITGTLPPGLEFIFATGTVSGTPTIAGAGITYSGIIITATSDAGFVSLPAFSIEVVDIPDTILGSKPPAVDSSASFSFGFSATVPGSTFECSLNGVSYAVCSTPYLNSISSCSVCRTETPMTFAVRAVSLAGKPDPTPENYDWTISQTIGELCSNVGNNGTVQLRATDYTANLNINRAGIFMNLRGGYDSGYSSNSGLTNIHGTVTIADGTVTFDNIVIL